MKSARFLLLLLHFTPQYTRWWKSLTNVNFLIIPALLLLPSATTNSIIIMENLQIDKKEMIHNKATNRLCDSALYCLLIFTFIFMVIMRNTIRCLKIIIIWFIWFCEVPALWVHASCSDAHNCFGLTGEVMKHWSEIHYM